MIQTIGTVAVAIVIFIFVGGMLMKLGESMRKDESHIHDGE